MRERLLSYATGAGAGVAAAVVFLAAIRTGAFAVALAYLSPMPLMIATLGWGLGPGLFGALLACGLAGAAAPGLAGGFAVGLAAPAWMLSAFAASYSLFGTRPAPGAPRAYPGPGLVAMAPAAYFAALGATLLAILQFAPGGFDNSVQALAKEMGDAIATSGAARALPSDLTADELAALAELTPVATALGGLMMHLFNLYLAARSVQLSGRLRRPWRDIPTGFRLPRWLAAPALAALATAIFAPSPIDGYGVIVAGVLGALFALQALAALHALSRLSPARPFLLGALYFALTAAMLWVGPALALLGLAESFVDMRGRAAGALRPRPKT